MKATRSIVLLVSLMVTSALVHAQGKSGSSSGVPGQIAALEQQFADSVADLQAQIDELRGGGSPSVAGSTFTTVFYADVTSSFQDFNFDQVTQIAGSNELTFNADGTGSGERTNCQRTNSVIGNPGITEQTCTPSPFSEFTWTQVGNTLETLSSTGDVFVWTVAAGGDIIIQASNNLSIIDTSSGAPLDVAISLLTVGVRTE